ncbi:hypothetical protein HPB52_015589 [Rhipicephalus sanguineus]|uniref:Transporter n=1 Tax=Rhipicephalus sanguineus TaxID=34632 RepID=A0A9D4T147_RHISA|nr:hypothetical protein HPB52_015589 [Rhipicephalus sanguineus]
MAERDQWGSKCTFLLSLIGMSVGMGNVWRFPYVVYVNGGGAFIIPYITLTLVAGRPMYLLELVLGVGWAMVYASVSLALFNSMVLAYVIIYLYYSMGNPTTLPWMQCDPSWADEQCYVKKEGIVIYITTTLPFGLLLIILSRVLALPGASVGLKFFIVPKWSEVLSVTLWGRAAEQVILSLGLGYGTVICYAGYGRIRNKLIKPHSVVCATVQAVLSPVRDEFTPTLRPRRWVLAASGCLALMFFGLPMTRQGICVTNIVFFEKLHIAGYDLPVWTTCVGITLVFIGLAIVVAFCVYHLYICEWDYDAALAINEDWGPRDPDEHLRYLAFLKSQGTEAAAEGQSEDTTTDARSQGQSSGEEGQSGIQAAVVVAVEDAPPEITAVLSDSPAMPTAPGVPSEGGAQRSGSDRNAGLTRTLVISESGVTVVTNPLSDGEEMPPKAASVS